MSYIVLLASSCKFFSLKDSTSHNFIFPDTIPPPWAPNYSQYILSKINGHLCLATADITSVRVFRYEDCKWQLRWKFQAPRVSSWVKVLGCGERNGLLVVETGPERSYALHVEKGNWTLLQGHPAAHDVFPLEITNPFAYPFPGSGIGMHTFV